MAELVIPDAAAEELEELAARADEWFPDSDAGLAVKTKIVRELRRAANTPLNRGRHRGDTGGQTIYVNSHGHYWTLSTYDPATDLFILHRTIYNGDRPKPPTRADLRDASF